MKDYSGLCSPGSASLRGPEGSALLGGRIRAQNGAQASRNRTNEAIDILVTGPVVRPLPGVFVLGCSAGQAVYIP